MKSIMIIALLAFGAETMAQTKTTEKIHKAHQNATTLFFYHNTLRMLNQQEDKQFDELIKDIEKLKFVMFTPTKEIAQEYSQMTSSYLKEGFEQIMNTRMEGKKFDVFLRDKRDKGMVITVNDGTSLYILDVVGSIALNNIGSVFNQISESSELADRLKKVKVD